LHAAKGELEPLFSVSPFDDSGSFAELQIAAWGRIGGPPVPEPEVA
jgi:hypothetical protein